MEVVVLWEVLVLKMEFLFALFVGPEPTPNPTKCRAGRRYSALRGILQVAGDIESAAPDSNLIPLAPF